MSWGTKSPARKRGRQAHGQDPSKPRPATRAAPGQRGRRSSTTSSVPSPSSSCGVFDRYVVGSDQSPSAGVASPRRVVDRVVGMDSYRRKSRPRKKPTMRPGRRRVRGAFLTASSVPSTTSPTVLSRSLRTWSVASLRRSCRSRRPFRVPSGPADCGRGRFHFGQSSGSTAGSLRFSSLLFG